MKIYEKILGITFVLVSLFLGTSFGFLIPLAFIAMMLVAFPVLIYALLFTRRKDHHTSQQTAKVLYLGTRFHQLHRSLDDFESPEDQIARITVTELNEITDLMPADGTLTQRFIPPDASLHDDHWIYRYHYKSFAAEFSAVGTGATPVEAFTVVKENLHQQIHRWHATRASDSSFIGQPTLSGATEKPHTPTVLIVEDDADVATATASIFNRLGCQTMISDGLDGVSQKMSFQHVDFIVLDWMLAKNIHGDQLVKSSIEMIDGFNDLKSRFSRDPSKVITYSTLDRSKVRLPENQYFDHWDHWQKPLRYNDLSNKASELLVANGF